MTQNGCLLLLACMLSISYVEAQNRQRAIIVDDKLGELRGEIEYYPGIRYQYKLRFWEDGVDKPYKIDPQTISRIEVKGLVTFRRIFMPARYEEDGRIGRRKKSKAFFMRLLYDGYPIKVWECLHYHAKKYHLENVMDGEIIELKSTVEFSPTSFEHSISADYKTQILSLANSLGVKIPVREFEKYYYDEDNVIYFAKLLNKTTVSHFPLQEIEPVILHPRWSVGVRGTYGKQYFEEFENAFKYDEIPQTGPTIEVQGAREVYHYYDYVYASLGLCISFSTVTGSHRIASGNTVNLKAREYLFTPFASLSIIPLKIRELRSGIGFRGGYSFQYKMYTVKSKGEQITRFTHNANSTQIELSAICEYKRKWRLEFVSGTAVFDKDVSPLIATGRFVVGISYRWRQ